QALAVLQNACGSPAVQVQASWAVWSQPMRLAPGAQFTITVTVTNVGTDTWPNGLSVRADDGSGNAIWVSATAPLSSLAPGATATVPPALAAPSPKGPGPQQLDICVTDHSGRPIQRGQAATPIFVE